MDLQKCGKLIAEKRKKLNLTQKQLGEQVGVSDKAVSKWERGLSFPDIGIVEKLAQTLDLSLSELLGGEEKADVPAQTETLLSELLLLFFREFARRRKRQILIAVSVLVILIPLVGMWAFVVQPVDGTGKTDSVQAQAFPSGNVLSFAVKTRVNPGDFYAFGDAYFSVRLKKAEMKEKLIAQFGAECVHELNSCLIVEQTDSKGRTDFYMLRFRDFSDGEKNYIWTGMRMGLTDGDSGDECIVIPLYLFDDSRINKRENTHIVCGAEYEVCDALYEQDSIPHKETEFSARLFKDFYEKSGWYTAVLQGNILTVQPTADNPCQYGFTVTFLKHSDKNYCTFDWVQP